MSSFWPLRPLSAASLCIALLPAITGCGLDILSLSPAPMGDFSFSATPSTSLATAGSAAPAYSFTVDPIGAFDAPVTVAIIPPPGISCIPVSCSATLPAYAANNILQLTPATGMNPGAYPLTFTATSGAITHTATATLTVAPPFVTLPPDFILSVTPTSIAVVASRTATAYHFTITPIGGFTGSVTVSTDPPPDFSCSPSTCTATVSPTSVTDILSLRPLVTCAPGTYTLTFTGVSGTLIHTTTSTVVVTAP
jgi:hypothetical protein